MEFVRTFGLLAFGAAAAGWDDELFFYRTGIALKLHELKCTPRMTGGTL